MKMYWENVHTIIFDFDGVFTDNLVFVDENGVESVSCDRSDGLALEMLHRFKKLRDWKLNYFVMSTEKNPVVLRRCEKLKIKAEAGISDKAEYLSSYLKNNGLQADGVVYLGNDLNDLKAMLMVGYPIAPCNAHPVIKKVAWKVFAQNGGAGFVRAFIEELLGVDCMTEDEACYLV